MGAAAVVGGGGGWWGVRLCPGRRLYPVFPNWSSVTVKKDSECVRLLREAEKYL